MGVLDLLIGVAFGVSALAAGGPAAERLLFCAVAVAWTAGTVFPPLGLLHQGALLIALASFPSGRPRGVAGWAVAVSAVPMSLLWPPGVIPLCAMAALAGGLFPRLAATGIGLFLGAQWALVRFQVENFDLAAALAAYDVLLLLVATVFPLAARATVAARRRLADRLLAEQPIGLDELATALGHELGDPGLRIHLVPGENVASVKYTGSDPATADAVATVVRLATARLRLQDERQALLRDLEASRARLVATADRERARIAAEARAGVGDPLLAARGDLRAVRARTTDPEAAGMLDLVDRELDAATREISELIGGLPRLGGGLIERALKTVTATSPVPVTLSVRASGTSEAESALYYVCSESLANAVKHASASIVTITLARTPEGLVATIADDGQGGADPAGSGLQGLADRLAARGGRLRVDSRPGAGTVVTATLPG
ncbi:hypothetical protein GCM10009555_018680 [Acrocarpospora macrocephala]|uniref:histidine kinase n=1 Tax=Acrocarpospora macrocephala TaxID=150177 RepID=A0A5M3WMI1_9ACTN|nr:ATP-binding protein [Acrocarpospora macrocephala]GES07528.1 hypothetical protein Amac_011230 [Acrocarpospora macrocephala]